MRGVPLSGIARRHRPGRRATSCPTRIRPRPTSSTLPATCATPCDSTVGQPLEQTRRRGLRERRSSSSRPRSRPRRACRSREPSRSRRCSTSSTARHRRRRSVTLLVAEGSPARRAPRARPPAPPPRPRSFHGTVVVHDAPPTTCPLGSDGAINRHLVETDLVVVVSSARRSSPVGPARSWPPATRRRSAAATACARSSRHPASRRGGSHSPSSTRSRHTSASSACRSCSTIRV